MLRPSRAPVDVAADVASIRLVVAYGMRVASSPSAPYPGSVHSRRDGLRRARIASLAVTVAASVGLWAVWQIFVHSRTGQQLDEAAFSGARFGQSSLLLVAEPVLDVISVPFIAVVLVAAMLVAVLQRRPVLAVQVAVLVGGANLSTQVLKHVVLDRPDLGVGDPLRNALPSGHTTAAASVAAALVFVVPRRLRPAAALLGVLYTVATGVSTLVGRWHRPSDVVAAVLVVLAWAGLAAALSTGGRTSPGTDPPRETVAVATLLLVAAAASGAGAGVALQRSLADLDAGLTSRAELLTAYGGGALGVVAVSCLAFGVLLLIRRSGDRPAETARQVDEGS